MKSCSFLHAHFFELMKVVENLFKKPMVENSFIKKTYVVGTHWDCLIEAKFRCEPTAYVSENKDENYLEIYNVHCLYLF